MFIPIFIGSYLFDNVEYKSWHMKLTTVKTFYVRCLGNKRGTEQNEKEEKKNPNLVYN